jgi:hypothetical protein
MKEMNGIYIYNHKIFKNYLDSGKYTICAMGSARGGTSLIAYILLSLGFELGSESSPLNHEDNNFLPEKFKIPNYVEEYIKIKNSYYDIWGFKMPSAVKHIQILNNCLRNPIYIFIYRNPLSVLKSIINNEKSLKKNMLGYVFALRHPLQSYFDSLDLLKGNQPVILLKYEDIKNNSLNFIKQLSEIFLIKVDEDELNLISENISKPGYKKITLSKLPLENNKKNISISRKLFNKLSLNKSRKDYKLSELDFETNEFIEFCTIENDDIVVISNGNDPNITINSCFSEQPIRQINIRLEIISSVDTIFEVFYRSINDTFSKINSQTQKIKRGINQLEFQIHYSEDIYAIRIDPANTAGKIRMKNVIFKF